MKPKVESAYLSVEKIDRAIEFYEWFLKRKGTWKGKSLFMFDVDGFRLFLFDHAKEEESVKYGDNCLLSCEVKDALQVRDELIKRGCKIVFPPTEILGNIVFEFEDPEGNHFEVFSRK